MITGCWLIRQNGLIHSCVLFFTSNLSNVHLFSFQGKFEMSWLNILSIDFHSIYTFIAFFAVPLGWAFWNQSHDCEVRTSMLSFIPPPTDHNWHKLATPPHFFAGIETGNASPAQWLIDTILSQKRWKNIHLAVTQWVHQGKMRNTHPQLENFHFAILKLRHCYLVLVIYTFR